MGVPAPGEHAGCAEPKKFRFLLAFFAVVLSIAASNYAVILNAMNDGAA